MTRLLLLADTHVPRRARDLPAQVWQAVEEADVVVHAGDWTDVSLLDALENRATRLIGVVGNNDGADLRVRLPEVARATLDGVRVAVVHETGSSKGREHRCASQYAEDDVLVFGHSHIPWDTTVTNARPKGLRLLNPGSPTDRRRQPFCTYMTAVIEDKALTDVELHQLPPRNRPGQPVDVAPPDGSPWAAPLPSAESQGMSSSWNIPGGAASGMFQHPLGSPPCLLWSEE